MRVYMTRRGFLAFGLSSLAVARVHAHDATHAHHPDAQEIALGSLADAELAFATTASHEGRRAAIFAHAAGDAVLLEERIVALRELGSAAAGASRVQSQPAQIGVARSHDLGYATGPFRSSDASGTPVHGVFLRLWRREGRSRWRIMVAAKVHTPRTVDFVPLGPAPRPSFTGKAEIDTARADIARLEARLAKAATASRSIAPLLAADVRWYREGAMPRAGATAIPGLLADMRRAALAVPTAIHVARSADLAVAYGATQRAPRPGWYLHVWLRRRDGTWRLAQDMASARARE